MLRASDGAPGLLLGEGVELPDEMEIGGPPFRQPGLVGAKADARRVVDERVEPDVGDAVGIERQRNAPRLPGAAHRNVLEPVVDQPQNLVPARLGLD